VHRCGNPEAGTARWLHLWGARYDGFVISDSHSGAVQLLSGFRGLGGGSVGPVARAGRRQRRSAARGRSGGPSRVRDGALGPCQD